MDAETIFVALLGEGTDVMRPVPAKHISGDIFEILRTDDYDPQHETWQFSPGTRVFCERRSIGMRTALFAVADVKF